MTQHSAKLLLIDSNVCVKDKTLEDTRHHTSGKTSPSSCGDCEGENSGSANRIMVSSRIHSYYLDGQMSVPFPELMNSLTRIKLNLHLSSLDGLGLVWSSQHDTKSHLDQ